MLVVYCAKHPAHKFTTVIVGPQATIKEIEEAVVTNMQDWGRKISTCRIWWEV